MLPRRALILLACIPILGFAAGCGEDEVPPPPDLEELADKASVTKEDVRKAPEDSPEEAILTWWRLTQFRSPQALDLFTPEAAQELDEANYQELAFRYLGPWLALARPEIEDVSEQDGSATVFVNLSGPAYLSPTKATLDLVRTEDGWLFSDPTFMLEQAQLLREQELANRPSSE